MLCERHRTRQKDVSSCSFWIFYHNNALPDKKWEKLEDKGLQGREKEEILWKVEGASVLPSLYNR